MPLSCAYTTSGHNFSVLTLAPVNICIVSAAYTDKQMDRSLLKTVSLMFIHTVTEKTLS